MPELLTPLTWPNLWREQLAHLGMGGMSKEEGAAGEPLPWVLWPWNVGDGFNTGATKPEGVSYEQSHTSQ